MLSLGAISSGRLREMSSGLIACLAGLALAAAPASAAGTPSIGGSLSSSASSSGTGPTRAVSTAAPVPNKPVLVTSQNTPPAGFRLTAAHVERIAARAPIIRDELRRHPHARPYEYTDGPGRWQVSWFGADKRQHELAQAFVLDATGRVTEAWTGFQVAWTMARGYPGAFGRRVNSLYVWLPLCALFFLAFVPRPRRWRGSGGGWSLLHLDLAVLLAFSVSLAFFDHARIGLSVPLVYPCLIYLLVRMLLLAFGRGVPRQRLPLLVPVPWLAVALVFLVGFRVGLNVADSNVIDVGYAGVIGAHKLVHGQPLYGGWPTDNAAGDTYGPANYIAYVPFYGVLGWSGVWDDVPAAHAAAIAFDLLTMLCLFLLGRSVRGPTLGVVFAYAWASFPFTLYALSSNSNDSLVALLIVLALLLLRRPAARGAVAALAGLAKFAPLALAPLFLRGEDERLRRGPASRFVIGFWAAALVVMLPVLLRHNLGAFWRDTVVYQANRPAPFSIWGLWGGLSVVQHVVQGAVLALGVAVAFVPRRRTWVTVAALAAAIMILLQVTLTYWFYLYIPWFFAPLIVALLGAHPAEPGIRMAGLEEPAPPVRERSPVADDAVAVGVPGQGGAPALRILRRG